MTDSLYILQIKESEVKMLREEFKGHLLAWIGGKRILRKTIAPLIPEDIKTYIEPFGGAAWVLFYYKKWADCEIYNDLDGRLVNLFRCVKYHPCELAREMAYMLASREQFLNALKYPGETDIQKAVRFLFVISRSFGASGGQFAIQTRCAISSAGGIIERIENISKRLDKVTIENKSAFDLIPVYDRPDSFFYLDPVYTKGAGYETSSTAKFNHSGLAEVLKNIKGRFLLSYDDAPMVWDLYKDFNIMPVSRANGITPGRCKEKQYKELLISNYEIKKSHNPTLWDTAK
ncbi:MAG: DNA adenine methylase [Candidatus Gastranaerophilales bacterium]|nr:DNA adenine methylase [Candidatus Gastranaerophilales bacterium]